MSKLAVVRIIAILLCHLAVSNVVARDLADEFEVKSVYLYNFARFFHWPEDTFENKELPFAVCIYGSTQLTGALQRLVGKTVHGRPLTLEHRDSGAGMGNCHVAYISASEQDQVVELLSKVGGQPVLTVSDMPGFARLGGVVGFRQVGNRLAFDINNTAAGEASLGASAQLLKLAATVLDYGESSP